MIGKAKVAVGMSGGVDSGVAALLLKQQGYEVVGFHCHFWSEADEPGFIEQAAQRWENKCCSTESLEAARRTAHQLDIPFYTIDFRKDFKKQVVDYFIGEYKHGRTPNPCVMCNKFIKFGKLLDYAKSLGCDYLATGHYARVEKHQDRHSGEQRDSRIQSPLDSGQSLRPVRLRSGSLRENAEKRQAQDRARMTHRLLKGVDKTKDQSYFLWTLTQEQLKHILFPIGDLTKERVRQIATEKNLPVANRPESFEICFIPNKDYRDFIRRQIPEKIGPGPVLNTQGETVGKHEGLPLYTIGQRHGFKVDKRNETTKSKDYFPPLYVVEIDVKKNALIVGRGAESERKEFEVREVNWIDPEAIKQYSNKAIKCEVRIRHQGNLLRSEVRTNKSEGSEGKVTLDEPTRGVTPGQSAVFYKGEEVLGGGIIK